MVSWRTWREHGESLNENTGFVKFVFESTSENATCLLKYSEFTISSCEHGVAMFESRYKNKGSVNSWFIRYFKMSIKPQEFQSFWSVGSRSLTLSRNLILSQIGIRCFRAKKRSQKFEIDHFCLGIFSAI